MQEQIDQLKVELRAARVLQLAAGDLMFDLYERYQLQGCSHALYKASETAYKAQQNLTVGLSQYVRTLELLGLAV